MPEQEKGALPLVARITSRLVLLVAAYLVALAAMWPLPMIANDAAVYAVVGQEWFDGRVPYRDLLVFKPPLLFLADGMGATLGGVLGVGAISGVRLVAALACAITAVAVDSLGRREGVRPLISQVFGLGAAFILAAYQFSGGGGLSEPPAIAFAMAAWAVAESGRSWKSRLFTGALATGAVGFSLLAVPFLLGPGLAVLTDYRRGGLRNLSGSLAAVGIGTLVVAGPVLGYFAAQETLAGLYDALVTYTVAYGGAKCDGPLGTCDLSGSLPLVVLYLVQLAPLLLFAGVALRRKPRPVRPLVVATAACLVAAVLLRRMPVLHYWWPVFLGLIPLAAIGVEATLARQAVATSQRMQATRLALAASVFLPVALVSLLLAARQAPIYPYWIEAPEAAAIVDRAPPGPLFLWGNVASTYLLTDRSPASRYPHAWGLSLPGFTTEARVAEACRELAAQRPVVVLSEVGAPDLTGTRQLPLGLERRWYEPIGRLLARDWEEVGRVPVGEGADMLHVLVPRDSANPTAADCGAGS